MMLNKLQVPMMLCIILTLSCNTLPQGWGTVNENILQTGIAEAKMFMATSPIELRESSLAGALGMLQVRNEPLSNDEWSQLGVKTALTYAKDHFPGTNLVDTAKTYFGFPLKMTDAEVMLSIVFAQWELLVK